LYRAEPIADGAYFLMPEPKNGDREMKPVLPKFRRYARHWPLPHDYSWHSRVFREARSEVGMEHIVPHDLRHSTASALQATGATLNEVGKVLGHRTAQATNRYAHLYAERKAELLATIWGKKKRA
jgi:integrase